MTMTQYEPPAPLPASQPGDELEPGPAGDVARLRAYAEYANYVAGTALVPETLRGKPDEVAAVILAGNEVGLRPMAALRAVAMIRGVSTFKAEALRGLVISKGHELWLEESTVTRAIAAARRKDSERVGRVTWTLDDAKRAGIGGQPNYQRYPREMLVARATAALARQMFPDVVMGLVAAEELDDFVYTPNGSTPAELAPPDDAPKAEPKTPARRRRTTAQAPAAADAPKAEPKTPVEPPPPADDQPEPPVPPEPLATQAYKNRIFATMRDLGMGKGEGDRDERLAYTSRVVGREISSSNELTVGEASKLIDQLEADQKARAAGEKAFLDELRTTLDATDAPTGSGGIQEPQWNRLQELFAEREVGGPAEQLTYCRGVLPRWKGETLTQLAADEASAVIAHLEQYDRDDPQTWPFPEGF